MVDYLSGDAYNAERSSKMSGPSSFSVPNPSKNADPIPPSSPPPSSSSPPSDYINPTASMFTAKSTYDEPARMTKSADHLPPAPWDVQPPSSLPPPPSKYNQRQQFFEQNQAFLGGASSEPGGYDSLVGPTQNLSLNRSNPQTKQEKPEDALFKDLVDFAKAKSSPSSSKPNRSF
ncbi:hypothetical protein U1Q18_048365 [Sarracenia purpurea var. burkii]